MAESSACLMRSFSQPSSISQDSQEGDPLRHALTTSVSFGRFMSESLAWEKWSSFTQNRYLEEVEKYAKPGSVAEKKAYFEAHYKRKAAQKAAAALEQQNAAVNDIPELALKNAIDNNSSIETVQRKEGCYVTIEEGQDEENPAGLNLSVDECSTDKGTQSPLEGYNIESDRFGGLAQGIQLPTFAGKSAESSSVPEYEQSPLVGCRVESDRIEVTDRGIEQSASVENQIELSILPEYGQSPQTKCSIESEEIHGGVEQATEHPPFVQKQVDSSPILEDAQCIVKQQEVRTPAQDAATKEVSAFSDKKKPASASAKLSGCRRGSRLRLPPKPTTPIRPKNGDKATSYHKRTGVVSAEKKKSTPNSLHMSINFGPRVGDTRKLSSPELPKMVNSRLVRNLSETTRKSTKQQTLTRASTSGVSKHLSATPYPAIGRTRKTLIHPISESVTGDRKSEYLHMRSSLSSTACRPKAQHPIVSASFNLRTEERAAKRKEKIQQKLSMEAAEKEHLQARVKGKVRNDAKGVRQSIISQGKANTSVHLGIKPLDVQMQKMTRAQPCSPGIERKQDSEVLLQKHSRPTWRHSVKADSFKDLLGKNHLPLTSSTKLLPQKKCLDENTSPNIQV